MPSITGAIKRAPKWAWWTVGGIAVGAGAIKLYKGRATDADPNVEPGTETGSPTYAGTGAPPGVIVPPVIIGGNNGDSGAVAGLADLFMSGILDFTHQYQDLYGPIMDLLPGLIMTPEEMERLMRGGDQPAPTGGPTIIVQPAPAPQAPPPAAPPAAPSGPAPCPSSYPFRSDRGCYEVACASGRGDKAKGRWHHYQNGDWIHVSPNC